MSDITSCGMWATIKRYAPLDRLACMPAATVWPRPLAVDASSTNHMNRIAKVSLAGIHYPDTDAFFGDTGITDVTEQRRESGWPVEDERLFMADHYRAAADMIVKWALSDSRLCNVEVAEWFPSPGARCRLLGVLDLGKPKLLELNRLQKVEAWLRWQ
ncbi:hypothetical protein RAM80_31050 (plasmid) [Pseudomonas sp. App30]|uniref:hypothetical protein n=1 Tax=Pseudomonas sp. App30 TaxID=3068990 RepID=UPI003A810CBA